MNKTNDEIDQASLITQHHSGVADELQLDEEFDYQGYQVVRREFLAHTQEPAITFNRYRIYVNSVCLKKMPAVEYVQALVNSGTKKLVIRPCSEDDRDSFQWRSNCKSGRRPKQITCRVFYAKMMELMGWDPELRYRLLGKMIRSNDEQLFLFDLTAPQTFRRIVLEQGLQKTNRTPFFPAEWKSQFGLPVEEHRKSLQIDLFQGYTVFGIRVPNSSVAEESFDAINDAAHTVPNLYGKDETQDAV